MGPTAVAATAAATRSLLQSGTHAAGLICILTAPLSVAPRSTFISSRAITSYAASGVGGGGGGRWMEQGKTRAELSPRQ